MSFDFPNATPPELIPLQRSFEPGDYRDSLKRLALDLFREHLGAAVFDANALGMAHLGSFDLVRRFIQADGLGLLRSDREADSTRYLYRAWKQADAQGRGMHFLRTYMQLLYPSEWEIHQLEQDKALPYPTATRHARGGDAHYLTSRVAIMIDANAANAPLLASFAPTIAAVVPARFVPEFSVFRAADLTVHPGAGLGSIGRSTYEPVVTHQNTADIDLGSELFGHAHGDLMPSVVRVRGQSGAVMFGGNNFQRRPCAAVRIVSWRHCLIAAAKDPTIPDSHQSVAQTIGRPPRAWMGSVMTDRRVPLLAGWPRGRSTLPDPIPSGLTAGGAVVIRSHDATLVPPPIVDPIPSYTLIDGDGYTLADNDGFILTVDS